MLFDLDLLTLELCLTFRFLYLCVDCSFLHRFFLFLLLNLVGGIGNSLLDILCLFQFRLFDGKLVLPFCDFKLCLNLCVVRFLRCFRLFYGNIAVSQRFRDTRILSDLRHIIRTEVFNKSALIGDILDVQGNDGNAELFHIDRRALHDLRGKSVPVRIDVPKGDRADDLAKISFQGILQCSRDISWRHIEEVSGSNKYIFISRTDHDLRDSIHGDIDEIVRRN